MNTQQAYNIDIPLYIKDFDWYITVIYDAAGLSRDLRRERG